MSTRANTSPTCSIESAPDFTAGEEPMLFGDVPVTFQCVSGKRVDGIWAVAVKLQSGSIGIVSAHQLHRVPS